LTAERFVADPSRVEAGARLSRTGDRGRWRELPDGRGALECLGRTDFQVKVRGYRIELGEIEAALEQHPGVRAAIVIVREDAPGDQRLTAYVVGGETSGELRRHLRVKLPEYMVPSAYVTLAELPLLPNGKVDRKALPAPEATAASRGFVAPEGPVEELLAEVWAEVLKLERVGARDNFFDLGGHSLLATQVVSRLRTAFEVELPLQRLFESPTVAGLARAVDEARRERRGVRVPAIQPVSRDGDLPLSFAQERMWFLHQLEPHSSAYNLASGLRLEGDLDAERLAGCFAAMVRRHETLRTVFAEVDGRPVQVIQPPADFALPVIDLRGLAPEEREAELRGRSLAESRRPFDLARGPLLRALLLRTGEREHALVLVMHHVVSDGWSMGLLLGELTGLYAGAQPASLPVQYADFAAWQREWLQGEELSRQVEYWKEQLAGAPPLLELPTDRPRPAVQSFRGDRRTVRLSTELMGALESLGRREGLTPFMLLMAAFQSLLGRFTSRDDVVVGTPIANRTRTEVERLIGFFANTLVFRTELADDPTFLDLARQVRGKALGAYDHQDLPFEKLVDELHPERHLSYPPVFQVMFILQNAPAPAVDLGGLTMRPLSVDRGQSPFDLTLMLADAGEGWNGWLEYVTDLFDAATVERWTGHLETLLRGIAEGPERRISEIPLLTGAERAELVSAWNQTGISWPRETLIHELFEQQAATKPEAWAVAFGSEKLSYAELEARSNRLARHLRGLGVGPEVRVGLCVERSAEMVVALLAILKAGGAYVPLDPSHPAERLGLVMEDSAVPVLVTESALLDLLPPHAAHVVQLDRYAEAIGRQSAAPLERVSDAESLAYVLYTSGSTGRPKGVGLPHRAVVNFLRAMAQAPGLRETDVVPAITTLSFDIAGLEIYLPLAVGARVEVLGREEAADGTRLAERLIEIGATTVQATPATWRLLIDSGWQGIPGLKVLCGGEALPRDLAEALLARGAGLWNVYGPTETAIWSAAGEVASGDGPVLIGRPIANTDFYVVDHGFTPAPVGVAGELLIGGLGLSRGYLHRSDLTAEKFVPHPFGEAGERIYRTGDLVRYRPSGELEFLGRIDTQVKVRGFRIELGEIEAALSKQPGVRQAVVVVRDERLVGYAVADAMPSTAELRESLRRSLPEYMIPSAFVALEAFPLTPSGKVDRKALPAPEAGVVGEGYVEPLGPVEELLAVIWAEVLRVERVGGRDNFFDLGGHSLLATQVVSRVRQALGVELPLQRLFENPTVAELARAVEAARRDQEGWSLPPILRVPRDQSFPLSFSQERMWFLNQLDPGTSAYNLSRAVRLRGGLDVAVLRRCFSELVRRHESLRTTFALVEGRPVQVIQPPAPIAIAIEVVDLRRLPAAARDAEARRWASEEAARPFDLARDPLIRATLLRLSGEGAEENEHALLLTLHHIASDGWSMGVLIRELATLYQALSAGEASPLPELPVQYVDFALWQRQALSGEVLEAEVGYWSAKLSGSPPPLLIPADRRRASVQGFQVAAGSIVLPRELAAGLKALSRRSSASLYMTLLAGWKALLSRVTGEEDVLLGAPIANRNRAEIEGLIGFFLNTLVLRTDASGDPAFGDLLSRVRETCLGAFAHQDLPLEQVLKAVQGDHEPGRSPFQVMFLLQNAPVQSIEVPGVTFSVQEADQHAEGLGTAIFEAGLTLMEVPDGIVASITYNALLFDEATVYRLLARYERLLAGAVADPSRPIRSLELMSEAERAMLLAWSGGEASPAGELIPRLFEERAARAPEAVAVIAGDRRLSYGELNREANRLAHHLRALGVGPDSVVGIAVERSPEMVVSLLAVLKAGGAYVPLDPTYPVERLAYILDDAAAGVLVTTERARSLLPGIGDGRRVVRLDADAAAIAARSAENPGIDPDPENLAYLIYTSGSTGKPKGVMIRHAALANYTAAFRDEHHLGPADRVLQFASISFDTSAEEIYPALTSGAGLALRNDAMLASTAELLRSCADWGVTVLDLPTAFWHELVARLEAEPASLPPGLRLIILGGERALPERIAAWHAQGHSQGYSQGKAGARLFNTYGPTETTIVATRAELTPGTSLATGEAPIGRPVRNLRAYVLEPGLSLAAPGVPGELCVGGAGLARGYVGRPDQTAESFVPDPWSREPGGRMYRTGDLVRLLPSGELEFLGRIDHQVKIRGFRVELREIEAALGEHPRVREAVVVAREDVPGDRRLAAYLVSTNGPLAVADLRGFLKGRLPEYMVPASFTELERLPLTPSGKVDRRALPAPDRARRELERDFVAPRSESEESIAAIFAEVLGLDRVGVTESFFDLGGHSLLLPQVIHKLRSAFQVEVPLRALFDEPTVEGLAITIEEILLEEIERQLGEEEAVVE
ncbi:MAG: amino acid adenylation domain-containing protein, partial [Thermoanaerobaculia bacterium]